MLTTTPTEQSREKFVWDSSSKQSAIALGLTIAGLTIGVLNQQKGPELSQAGVSKSVPKKENVTPSVTNEEIFASFKMKTEKDSNYTPTRAERIALAKLGIAVNDEAPIPYEGDGKEE